MVLVILEAIHLLALVQVDGQELFVTKYLVEASMLAGALHLED